MSLKPYTQLGQAVLCCVSLTHPARLEVLGVSTFFLFSCEVFGTASLSLFSYCVTERFDQYLLGTRVFKTLSKVEAVIL